MANVTGLGHDLENNAKLGGEGEESPPMSSRAVPPGREAVLGLHANTANRVAAPQAKESLKARVLKYFGYSITVLFIILMIIWPLFIGSK